MEDEFRPIWDNATYIIAGGILATLLANLTFALRALQAKPAQTLRARE
jgi:putative ABC transport system permease protein